MSKYAIARVTIIDKATGQPRPIYFGKACRVELLDTDEPSELVPVIAHVVVDGKWTTITPTATEIEGLKQQASGL
jgi:hypothetical protein